jgi:UDP-3-O-[3-hydroxymyristoyl] glucosamine N-acyltransferase
VSVSVTLAELAAHVGGEVVGDGSTAVTGVRALDQAGPGDLSFYHNRRYLAAARATAAGVLLVADPSPFPGRALLVCREPYAALGEILRLFHPETRPPAGVHPSAVVAPSAAVGEGASVAACAVIGDGASVGARAVVGPCSVLGAGATIGDDTVLHPNVVVESGCRIGARCIVHAGTVVGSDGFGFATVRGEHRKVPQVGIVVVEDDVELGANVCIDRAALGETRIGRGTKVDNLVQIGHNVQIGPHSLIVAQVGISGSAKLGHHVVMAGQSGSAGHLTIADGTQVAAQAAVMHDTPPGAVVAGSPARPLREYQKAMAGLYRLEELRARVKALEAAVARLGGEKR